MNSASMWGRQCSEWDPLKAMQTEKTATPFSLHPSYPFSPAGVNLRLGGLCSWAKWMTTPGHHHPHFSPVVNVYWLCATSQDDSVHSGSVVLWFSLYILVYFLSLLLILLLICYPSSCYCDFSLETLCCQKTRSRKVWLLSSGGWRQRSKCTMQMEASWKNVNSLHVCKHMCKSGAPFLCFYRKHIL